MNLTNPNGHDFVQREVQAQLLSTSKERKRRPGDIVYPFSRKPEFGPWPIKRNKKSPLMDLENWDLIFRKACLRHQLTSQPRFNESPPSVVLDLGCGSGQWVLEAAKEWPNSTIYGLDCYDQQPNLRWVFPDSDLPDRVHWVRKNFLEGLPFENDFFDFVHVSFIGLGVPEDEWQDLLEELRRVMKPGSLIEVTEEDLIFPCSPVQDLPLPIPQPLGKQRPSRLVVDLPIYDGLPSSSEDASSRTFTSSSDSWPPSLADESETPHAKASLTTLHGTISDDGATAEDGTLVNGSMTDYGSTRTSNFSGLAPTLRAQSLYIPSVTSPTVHSDHDTFQTHPQDHSRLKAAWEAMLNERFISPGITSVLPFYASSVFSDMKTHPPMEFELPKNSSMVRKATLSRKSADTVATNESPKQFFNPESLIEATTHWKEYTVNEKDSIQPDKVATEISVAAWPCLHLARTVRTVMECKEAMWDQYKRIHRSDQPPTVVSSPRLGYFSMKTEVYSTRELFDRDWENWENDMMDRIQMRKYMKTHLAWNEPISDRPDWRIWRSNMDVKGAPESGASRRSLCRSMRGFVARK